MVENVCKLISAEESPSIPNGSNRFPRNDPSSNFRMPIVLDKVPEVDYPKHPITYVAEL